MDSRYGGRWSDLHGKDKGFERLIQLDQGETIVDVKGCEGRNGIDSIKFVTNKAKVFGPFGQNSIGGTVFTSSKPGNKLSHFSGRAGDNLNALTLYFDC